MTATKVTYALKQMIILYSICTTQFDTFVSECSFELLPKLNQLQSNFVLITNNL